MPAAPSSASCITLGFVGKRKLPDGETTLRATLAHLFDRLEREFPGPTHELVGCSALALGADTVFAELVTQRGTSRSGPTRPGYALRVILPASPAEFFIPDDFRLTDAEPASVVRTQLARSQALLHTLATRQVSIVGTADNRDDRFAEAAAAIVEACDLLLVACTQADKAAALGPLPSTEFARGGSAETLYYAHGLGKRLLIIEVDAPAAPTGLLPVTEIPTTCPLFPRPVLTLPL